MNVLHLQLTGNPGGIVSLCYSIAKNSKNNNHMYFLINGGTVEKSMKEEGIPTYVAYANSYFWHKSKKELVNYCRANNIDVIVNHSNSAIACAHILEVKRRIPRVKVITYLHSNAKDILGSFKRRYFFKPYIKKVHKIANHIVAISNSVKQSALKEFKLNDDQIIVVYNGVDCKRFSDYKSEKDDKVLELIFVGRLFDKKGVNLLIEAISSLPNDVPVRLKVVGGGPDKEKLENLSKELGVSDNIEFLGPRMDVPELLSKAHFFVHPAIWEEGFGITIIEAMAEGLPCIAFNKGAIPEIIEDGKNGFIINEVSSKALSDKINYCNEIIRSDKYSLMSDEAIKGSKKFDISIMVKKLEELY